MRFLTALLAVASMGCQSAPSSPDPTPAGTTAGSRVLFVGNSLTQFNGLSGMVRALARQAGLTVLRMACRREADGGVTATLERAA